MTNFFNSLFSKSKQSKSFKNFKIENCFRTNNIGGLYVDVVGLINSNTFRWSCKMTNGFLKSFILRNNDSISLTDSVVVISNFGIVDNIKKVYEQRDDIYNEVTLFEFKDAKEFIADSTSDVYRIDAIEKMNCSKYTYLLK